MVMTVWFGYAANHKHHDTKRMQPIYPGFSLKRLSTILVIFVQVIVSPAEELNRKLKIKNTDNLCLAQ